MKAIRRLLAFTVATVLGLIAALAVVVFLLLLKPELEIPDGVVKQVTNWVLPRSMQLAWRDLHIHLHSHSLLDKTIHIEGSFLCFEMSSVGVCADAFETQARVALRGYFVSLIQIENLKVEAQLAEQENSPESSFNPAQLGTYLRWVWLHFGHIDVRLARAIVNGPHRKEASAHLRKSETTIELDGSVALPEPMTVHVQVQKPEAKLSRLIGEFQLKYKPHSAQAMQIQGSLNSSDWEHFDFHVDGHSQQPKAHVEIHGHGHSEHIASVVSAEMPAPVAFRIHNCPVTIEPRAWRLRTDCGDEQIRITPPKLGVSGDVLQSLRLSLTLKDNNLSFDMATHGRAAGISELTDEIAVQGSYQMSSQNSPVGAWRENLKLEHAHGNLSLMRFEKLVQLLKRTAYAIPAPFNSLSGPVVLQLSPTFDHSHVQVQADLSTQLAAREQSLKTTTRAQLGLNLQSKSLLESADVDVTIDDLLFTLPHMTLNAPPPLMRDGRFAKPTSAPVETPQFQNYAVRVHTTRPDSVRIASNLTGHPLPLFVDIKMTGSKGLEGTLSAARTPIHFMRRQAELQYFRLIADPATKRNRVDGKITVNYTDYVIIIRVIGTTDEPRLLFDSQPPLDQNQVLAVLIFGQPLDQLEDEQRASVAQMNSAVSSAALSLGSMYLLASTPIEQIAYNPDTKMVSARVRLDQGLSLSLGSRDGELGQVGLRKRLGANWALNTYIEDFQQTTTRTVSVFLEWFRRF